MAKKRSGNRNHKPTSKFQKNKKVAAKKPKSKKLRSKKIEVEVEEKVVKQQQENTSKKTSTLVTSPENKDKVKTRGRGDSGMILLNENKLREDLLLLAHAVKGGWLIRRKPMIIRRLLGIIEKTQTEVVCREGTVFIDSKADENAIKAATVLAHMEGHNLKLLDSLNLLSPLDKTPQTMVNVNVNTTADSTVTVQSIDSRAIELARLAKQFGITELVSEDKSYSSEEYP